MTQLSGNAPGRGQRPNNPFSSIKHVLAHHVWTGSWRSLCGLAVVLSSVVGPCCPGHGRRSHFYLTFFGLLAQVLREGTATLLHVFFTRISLRSPVRSGDSGIIRSLPSFRHVSRGGASKSWRPAACPDLVGASFPSWQKLCIHCTANSCTPSET